MPTKNYPTAHQSANIEIVRHNQQHSAVRRFSFRRNLQATAVVMNPSLPTTNKRWMLRVALSKQNALILLLTMIICYLLVLLEVTKTDECFRQRQSGSPLMPLTAVDDAKLGSRLSSGGGNTIKEAAQTRIDDYSLEAAARRARPLPACASKGTTAKTFLIVFMGHSGSTAIASELRLHSQIQVLHNEPLDHQKVFNTTLALQKAREIFDRGLAEGTTPGFKIRPAHILTMPNEWAALAKEYDTRIIWQYRKNLWKSAVGEYAHRFLNDTSSVEGLGENITKSERCRKGIGCSFPIKDLRYFHSLLVDKFLSQILISRGAHDMDGGRGCVLEVPYEDYLYEREATMAQVQSFLGLSFEATSPQRFKATGDNMCEVVENWDEVCTNFYGCVLWQPMLDDARNKCFCSFSSLPTRYCRTDHFES